MVRFAIAQSTCPTGNCYDSGIESGNVSGPSAFHHAVLEIRTNLSGLPAKRYDHIRIYEYKFESPEHMESIDFRQSEGVRHGADLVR